jgi:hypothetical protein
MLGIVTKVLIGRCLDRLVRRLQAAAQLYTDIVSSLQNELACTISPTNVPGVYRLGLAQVRHMKVALSIEGKNITINSERMEVFAAAALSNCREGTVFYCNVPCMPVCQRNYFAAYPLSATKRTRISSEESNATRSWLNSRCYLTDVVYTVIHTSCTVSWPVWHPKTVE